MKLNYILVLLLVLSVFTGCGDYFNQDPLLIQNNSSERIFHWYSSDYSRYHFPDTLLPTVMPVFFGQTASKNRAATGIDNPDWGNIYTQLPDGKLSVYFFKHKPKTQQQWESLINNPDSVYRKDITVDELNTNGHIVNYP